MIQHPVFSSKDQTDFNSYYAGYSFGQCYYRYNPKLSELALLNIVGSLKPTHKFSSYWYRRGFYSAYYNSHERQWQTCLPLLVTKERREQIMGKLTQAKKQAQGWNGYLKAAQIIEHRIPFCMRKISTSTGNYGPQWDIEIQVSEGILETFGAPEGTLLARLSLARSSNGRPSSKDDMLQNLMDQVPVHNCSLVSIDLKNGKTFTDFREVEAPLDVEGSEVCRSCNEKLPQDDTEVDLSELDSPF